MSEILNLSIPLAQSRIYYQWMRLEQYDQWWHWLILFAICLSIIALVVFVYRRDSVEHPRSVGWAMLLLRIAALVGLLLFYLQLDKRSEQRVVRSSRIAVLVDTSMSMSLPGTPSELGVSSPLSRAEEVRQVMKDSDLLKELTEDHELTLYRFDAQARPGQIVALQRSGDLEVNSQDEAEVKANEQASASLQQGRRMALIVIGVACIAAVLLFVSLSAQLIGFRNWTTGNWLLLVGSLFAVLALGLTPLAVFGSTQYTLGSLLQKDAVLVQERTLNAPQEAPPTASDSISDWSQELGPSGIQTRLGDAIRSILEQESGNPLAAIVIFTDGRSNAGVSPKQTIAVAQGARVPLHFVGVGSVDSPANVQLVEIDAPKRLYPGDKFSMRALVSANGFDGKPLTVQVMSGPVEGDPRSFSMNGEQEVVIAAEDGMEQAEFKLAPRSVGKWKYVVQVLSPGQEDIADNRRELEIEVVERKNRVLVIAGGPTREYQFVRNLLFRDRDVESHVLLQTATPMSSQEAQQILTEFPSDRNALSQYDAVLAFDADWTAFPEKAVQDLEKWVAEQAGGLLLVAGSVEMPKWTGRSGSNRATRLRSLSPVMIDRRGGSRLATGRIESAAAWPLTLTQDGSQTDFMWIDEEPLASMDMWEQFEGVHSFYSAYELKPGAKALALYNDPTTSVNGQLPIYIASQFYGAGRVVFMGGGEIWRLRSLGDQFFDRYYTKLVRWISQGRLLLDSDRGVLLVDREQAFLGEQVVVRAVLKNEQYEPLVQAEVVARLIDSQQRNTPLVLRPLPDGSQPGVYVGQFPVLVPGEYNLQLQMGGIASEEGLNASVRARIPAAEMQQAERDDVLMKQIAEQTGGRFWAGARSTTIRNETGKCHLAAAISSQDTVSYIPGAPDAVFQVRWLGWLMALIATCLSLEWFTRRIHRLA